MSNLKARLIIRTNDHARDIATGFLTDWIARNVDATRAGDIPESPTRAACEMFAEECYPKYNTAAFRAQWAADRAFLLSE